MKAGAKHLKTLFKGILPNQAMTSCSLWSNSTNDVSVKHLQGDGGWREMREKQNDRYRKEEVDEFLVDEFISGLHVGLVNDWCICQPRSCEATISQPAEEGSNGWKRRERETERETDRKY